MIDVFNKMKQAFFEILEADVIPQESLTIRVKTDKWKI